MKITKSQLKQIIKEELSEVINEAGVPLLSAGLGRKSQQEVNLVFKDDGDFYDGPFTEEEAQDYLNTLDPRGELKMQPVKASLSDFEDAYEKGASPEDIIALISKNKNNF